MKVFLVDDHPLILMGVQDLLEDEPDLEIVGTATTGKDALDKIPLYQPDMIILDCRLPDMKGVEIAREVKRQGWGGHVVALSAYDDAETIHEMREAGAKAYLLKTGYVHELIFALRSVARGHQWFSQEIWELLIQGKITELENGQEEEEEEEQGDLTIRQSEILRRVALGHTDAQIAMELGVTTKAVNRQLGRILIRLGAPNRTNAVYRATKKGWI